MTRPALLALFALTLGVAPACREAPAPAAAPAAAAGEPSASPPPPSSPSVPSAATAPLFVVLGDSLAAGYGLAADEAFPALVAAELERRGTPVRLVNAGVSGDTTAGGVARLDWLLRQRPDVLLVELGGNDGLRGLPLAATEENLRQIVVRARAGGARVILAGMMLPANLGPDYTQAFAAIYPRLARELDVPLIPFLLEGVGGVTALNLPDGIHPTPEGHRRVARMVVPYVARAIEEVEGGDRRAAATPSP